MHIRGYLDLFTTFGTRETH